MEEPLNLTIKKKPVAIVAPSFDSNQNVKTVNYNKLIELCEKVEDGPQDLSLKKSEDKQDDKRNNNDKTMNYFNNNNDHEELRKYLFKNVNDEVRNNYNKNSFDLKTNIFKDVYKINDIYEKNFTSQQDSIYTMINHLAEHKFLTAWYMNSVLNMNLPYLNSSATTTTTSTSSTTATNNNSILNNLLNKKSGDSKIDTIIKNDTNKSARSQVDQKNNVGDGKNNQDSNSAADKKKPHIKKPLNAFMLYMKEMRAKVVAECTLKESAAINQILGRKWHALGREEQAKYYELARRERQLHMQLYPDWSSRANATRGKKRKRKQDPADGGNSMKKCRARYGLDQQSQWCKPCRRKKKCIRYMEAGDSADGNQSDDNLGSCGSMGDAHTPPEDDAESLNQSVSSPGGLSALSSLTSPGGVVLPSPSTSVASPSVSVASPYMLQSPLTPHEAAFDVKLVPPPPSQQQHQQLVQLHHHPPRNPVGTNPHDINNPLSVNQLTGQCVKNEPPDSSGNKDPTRSIISVT